MGNWKWRLSEAQLGIFFGKASSYLRLQAEITGRLPLILPEFLFYEPFKSQRKVGNEEAFPLLYPARTSWLPLSGGLLCGVVYGVSSGFGLPYMVDQIFPKIFPNDDLVKKELSSYQLALYVALVASSFFFDSGSQWLL